MTDPLHYLLIDNQQTGPYTLSQLKAMWETGIVSATTLFWKEGQAAWEPLLKISFLLDPPHSSFHQNPPQQPASPLSAYQSDRNTRTNERQETSSLAISSLILGCLGFLLGITALPAVICGHMSLGHIKRAAGSLTGRGMAIAGIVMGYLALIVLAFILLADLKRDPKDLTSEGVTKGAIFLTTCQIFEKKLKSPTTAKFPSYYQPGAAEVVSLGGGQYSVRSYVDSQNSFGAMIRTKWTATVTVQMNDKTIRLNDFQTE